MFIDTNSIVIDTINFGQYLVEAKYGYHKLWSSDSGRNLLGTQSGTLLGVFPKLTLQFRTLTKEELNIVAPILDSARQELTYYDPSKDEDVTITTYTGDWELVNQTINQNTGFSCAFISTAKRV